MRINNWSDEEGFPGDFALQEANRRRSLQSRAGRKALKRLERALLAMEEKKLYADVLVDPNGEVCAIGAVMVQEKMDEGASREEAAEYWSGRCEAADTEDFGAELGFPKNALLEVIWSNDAPPDKSPEGRYREVLEMTQRNLRAAEAAEAGKKTGRGARKR